MNSMPSALAFLLMIFAGWVNRQQLIAIDYLKAGNRMLLQRLNGRRLRFTDAERALLARKAKALGRKALLELGTIVTPDTLLRWHRQQVRFQPSAQTGPSSAAGTLDCVDHSDGHGEPALGLHPDPRRADECWAHGVPRNYSQCP